MADEEALFAMFMLVIVLRRRRRRRLNNQSEGKRVWIKDIYSRRTLQGDFHNLVQELRLGDRELYLR